MEALKTASESLTEEREEMQEHGNEFAKEFTEYEDIAELHMARIEQVMMEEL